MNNSSHLRSGFTGFKDLQDVFPLPTSHFPLPTSHSLMMMIERITVIIPVLNEQEMIENILVKLISNSDVEIIVVDGGSQDKTVEIVKKLGVKVILSEKMGRGFQMNQGAKIATGNIFLFLHADTQLPPNYQDLISSAFSHPKTVAGAFKLKIDNKRIIFRVLETLVNWRSRFFSLPYGDQAIFLKASVFQQLGGVADLPIMEDFELIQRLKTQGKITLVPASVITSDRRWRKLGVFRTTVINQWVILGYYLGIPLERLADFYRKSIK